MDPLTDILSVLHPHDCVAAGLDAGGSWAVDFGAHVGLKCNAIVKGECSLAVEGGEPIVLAAGDCVVLPHGRPFTLSSDMSAQPKPVDKSERFIYGPPHHGGTAVYGGGGAFYMTGARFLLAGPAADMLLNALPSVMVLRSSPQHVAIQWILSRIADELKRDGPGGSLAITHLSHLLLVEVMRGHMGNTSLHPQGWLAALSDPRLAPAVAAVHARPAHPWTVAEMAATVAQSRTSFATRFRRVVGQSPIDYLTQWRILKAAEQLRGTDASILEVAIAAGYASESAFNVAFRRVMGAPPRSYIRNFEQ